MWDVDYIEVWKGKVGSEKNTVVKKNDENELDKKENKRHSLAGKI